MQPSTPLYEGRVRRGVERPSDRRTLRRWHHPAHTARKLVDGQESHRHADRHFDQAGRLHSRAARADSRMETPGDARSEIRIEDILHMSSGLRIRAPQDPGFDPSGPYPDHLYLYTGGVNSFHYAATRPLQWPPNTIGRYHNCDPVLINYLIRLAVEKRGEEYLSFPQRALFDKLGIRTMVMETDPYGNFLTQGYEFASGRDWARLGMLYLQDGVWNGERILPEGYSKFVSTLAPAWKADHRPVYGAFFWLNGDGAFHIPKESYYMAGAGGQYVFIIPSHDLVVVRLGHYKGANAGGASLNKAFSLLMQAIPQKN